MCIKLLKIMKKTILTAAAIIAIGSAFAQGVPSKKDNVTSGGTPSSNTVGTPTKGTATPTNKPGTTSSATINKAGSGPNKSGNAAGGINVQGPKTTPAVNATPAKSGSGTPATGTTNNPGKG